MENSTSFSSAEGNRQSITDPLPEGTLLRYAADDVVSEKVVERYAQERVSPATDIDDKELNTLLYGGGIHGKIGFFFILIAIIHTIRHRKWFRISKG